MSRSRVVTLHEDMLGFFVPMVATFGVVFMSGYLLGIFGGYEQAVQDRDTPSEPRSMVPEGEESPVTMRAEHSPPHKKS